MKKKKVQQLIILLAVCTSPLIGALGCGFTDTLKCTACGDNQNRLILYASGTSDDGTEYKSCVGPAGCLGIGLDTACWPTECLKVENNSRYDGMSGCIYYYNDFGCIGKSNTYSKGKYFEGATFMGISCMGSSYIESVNGDSTEASRRTSCLGMSCEDSVKTETRNLNKKMPRQFKNGCWSCTN